MVLFGVSATRCAELISSAGYCGPARCAVLRRVWACGAEREIDNVEVMVDGKEQFVRKMNDMYAPTLLPTPSPALSPLLCVCSALLVAMVCSLLCKLLCYLLRACYA